MKALSLKVILAGALTLAAPAFSLANPFSDVPSNHWARESLESLSALGVIEGLPDGSFMGSRRLTRFEMAQVIARAAAQQNLPVEAQASLVPLMSEFNEELRALGVTVEGNDRRLQALEENWKGWRLFGGELRLEWQHHDEERDGLNRTRKGLRMARYRLWLSKTLNPNLRFMARINTEQALFDRWFFTLKDFWGGTTLTAGRFMTNWEKQDKLYGDNDPIIGGTGMLGEVGFSLKRPFNWGEVEALTVSPVAGPADEFIYGGRIKVQPSSRFWFSLNGQWATGSPYKNAFKNLGLDSVHSWWAAAGLEVMPGAEFKGAWYVQNLKGPGRIGFDSSPTAWKLALDISQKRLGFTSIWLEYAHFGRGFVATHNPWNDYDFNMTPGLMSLENESKHSTLAVDWDDVDVWFIKASQKWNDQWQSFGRFFKAQGGAGRNRDVSGWSVGLTYQYTPALNFELIYDSVSYDKSSTFKDNQMVLFRTHLSF